MALLSFLEMLYVYMMSYMMEFTMKLLNKVVREDKVDIYCVSFGSMFASIQMIKDLKGWKNYCFVFITLPIKINRNPAENDTMIQTIP
jgi:hypothetical protein